jgi:hypothetical protein
MIACDCDPDRPEYGGDNHSTFRGLSRAIADIGASSIPVTWFVRSDLEYPGGAFSGFGFEALQAKGHELAWHCHFWRKGPRGWYQESEDSDWLRECIAEGYRNAQPPRPRFVRTGWCFQSTFTLRAFAELGIVADFSCSPDMVSRALGPNGLPIDRQDWLGAPTRPYYPLGADTRLLEIPTSTYPLSPMKRFTRTLRTRTVRRRGSVGIASEPLRVRRCFADLLRQAGAGRAPVYFLSYIHPDAMLAGADSGVGENRDDLWNNLRMIERMAQDERVPCKYVTASELYRVLTDKTGE